MSETATAARRDHEPRPSAGRLLDLLGTTIGSKQAMALTGLGLLGFLVAHMLGNLRVFAGPDAINGYAAWLHANPLLWVARLGLLGLFSAHVYLAIALDRRNRAARKVRYAVPPARKRSTFASRHLLLTGLLVLSFLVFHLAHFTFGWVGSEPMLDARGRHDVYGMIVHGFQQPWVALTYVAANLLLGLHLVHGAQSFLQTIGLRHETYDALLRGCLYTVVFAVVVGNCLVPVLLYAGVMPQP